jgi:hypothetical protein
MRLGPIMCLLFTGVIFVGGCAVYGEKLRINAATSAEAGGSVISDGVAEAGKSGSGGTEEKGGAGGSTETPETPETGGTKATGGAGSGGASGTATAKGTGGETSGDADAGTVANDCTVLSLCCNAVTKTDGDTCRGIAQSGNTDGCNAFLSTYCHSADGSSGVDAGVITSCIALRNCCRRQVDLRIIALCEAVAATNSEQLCSATWSLGLGVVNVIPCD